MEPRLKIQTNDSTLMSRAGLRHKHC